MKTFRHCEANRRFAKQSKMTKIYQTPQNLCYNFALQIKKEYKMPPIDEKKEKLSELRRWQNYFVSILIAVVAFVAVQYDSVNSVLFYLCVGVALLSIVIVVLLARKINKTIKEIGRLWNGNRSSLYHRDCFFGLYDGVLYHCKRLLENLRFFVVVLVWFDTNPQRFCHCEAFEQSENNEAIHQWDLWIKCESRTLGESVARF